MKTQATAKFIGTSARKTGLVAGLIRGRRALEAQVILANADQRAAGVLGKVLASAIANAENNNNLKAKDLIIDSVLIGPAKPLKRSRARAKGSASAILKRSSHVTVIVSDGGLVATVATPKAEAALAAGVTPVEAEVVTAKETKAQPKRATKESK
ncbi:50S ribosomal protein L22 [Candidatus Saccharibacteria bacterium]|nr:50S ribosomal protein L22 [Candidatus Saccharibacteria bacterium]